MDMSRGMLGTIQEISIANGNCLPISRAEELQTTTRAAMHDQQREVDSL